MAHLTLKATARATPLNFPEYPSSTVFAVLVVTELILQFNHTAISVDGREGHGRCSIHQNLSAMDQFLFFPEIAIALARRPGRAADVTELSSTAASKRRG